MRPRTGVDGHEDIDMNLMVGNVTRNKNGSMISVNVSVKK